MRPLLRLLLGRDCPLPTGLEGGPARHQPVVAVPPDAGAEALDTSIYDSPVCPCASPVETTAMSWVTLVEVGLVMTSPRLETSPVSVRPTTASPRREMMVDRYLTAAFG